MARSMFPGLQDGWSTTMVLSIPWVMVTTVLIVSWSTSEMIIREEPGWTRTALNYTSIFASETTSTHQHHHHLILHCSNKVCHCMSLIYYILESLFQFLHFIICILRTSLVVKKDKNLSTTTVVNRFWNLIECYFLQQQPISESCVELVMLQGWDYKSDLLRPAESVTSALDLTPAHDSEIYQNVDENCTTIHHDTYYSYAVLQSDTWQWKWWKWDGIGICCTMHTWHTQISFRIWLTKIMLQCSKALHITT